MLRHLVTHAGRVEARQHALDVKVDELAQANMRLYEMNRLKSDFLATMSHELRTPLNSIIGFSDVLESIDSLDDKQQRYVQNIQKSGRVLLEMINDILDLAKIESGKMEVRLSDFRIDARRARAVRHGPAADRSEEHRPGRRRRAGPAGDVSGSGQGAADSQQPAVQRHQVHARGGPDRRCVRPDRGDRANLLLQVADTGVGIAEEDQVAIFEKFRQGKSVLTGGDAMTREYSGTGLGLSIVKELCKLLGGEISLESELGKGSTFTVRLPVDLRRPGRVDSAVKDNLEEMLRPRRQECNAPWNAPYPRRRGWNGDNARLRRRRVGICLTGSQEPGTVVANSFMIGVLPFQHSWFPIDCRLRVSAVQLTSINLACRHRR